MLRTNVSLASLNYWLASSFVAKNRKHTVWKLLFLWLQGVLFRNAGAWFDESSHLVILSTEKYNTIGNDCNGIVFNIVGQKGLPILLSKIVK